MLNTFRTAVLIIFIVFIVVGVLLFSGVFPGIGPGSSSVSGPVAIWGTEPQQAMQDTLGDIRNEYDALTITYVEKRPSVYERELVEALAAGSGPDIFMFPAEWVVRHGDKVSPLPYDVMSRRDFRNTFIEEGELFLTQGGILALPVSVDPVVMYWNRDLFSSAGIAKPPQYWDQLLALVPQLTRKDQAANILQSGAALGESRNITHSKAIISALILQTQDSIVARDEEGSYTASISDGAESAMRFYTEFANPANNLYAWNRSLPNSREMFTAEELALYFGRASDIRALRTQNPHLNFDVAPLPQIRDRSIEVTFGALTGISVAKQSSNPQAAFFVAQLLANAERGAQIASTRGEVPARRGVLSEEPEDPYLSVFYESALISRGWFDPDSQASSEIFRGMIENISSGRLRISESVNTAQRQMQELLR